MRTRVTPRKSPRSLFTLLTALTNMRSWRMLVSSSKIAAILIGRGIACKLGVASMRSGRRIRNIFAEDWHHQGIFSVNTKSNYTTLHVNVMRLLRNPIPRISLSVPLFDPCPYFAEGPKGKVKRGKVPPT